MRHDGWPAASGIAAASVLLLLGSSLAAQPLHSDEIRAYAVITAMAQTASDRCADILVNNNTIAKAPAYFHLTPGDEKAVRLANDLEMGRLDASIRAASSVKAWCDEAYRAYGPDGDVAKGLLGK